MEKHISVLLNETIDSLNIKSDGIYIDATLGFAGHSSEILKRIPEGRLIAFDKDKDAVSYSENRLKSIRDNFKIYNEGFENIKKRCQEENWQSYRKGRQREKRNGGKHWFYERK